MCRKYLYISVLDCWQPRVPGLLATVAAGGGRAFSGIFATPRKKSPDFYPIFGKALYYGAAGISEIMHNVGFRPGERIHSFPPAYMAVRCSGGPDERRRLWLGVLINGQLP